jgi:hypothetical protein
MAMVYRQLVLDTNNAGCDILKERVMQVSLKHLIKESYLVKDRSAVEEFAKAKNKEIADLRRDIVITDNELLIIYRVV